MSANGAGTSPAFGQILASPTLAAGEAVHKVYLTPARILPQTVQPGPGTLELGLVAAGVASGWAAAVAVGLAAAAGVEGVLVVVAWPAVALALLVAGRVGATAAALAAVGLACSQAAALAVE